MKKIYVFMWLAVAVDLLYILALGVLVLISFSQYATVTNINGGAILITPLITLFTIGLSLLIKIALAFFVPHSAKGDSQSIILEVISIILFSGILGFGNVILTTIVSTLSARFGGVAVVSGVALINSSLGWIDFLLPVSNSLLIIGCVVSCCYKKWYRINDDFGSQEQ